MGLSSNFRSGFNIAGLNLLYSQTLITIFLFFAWLVWFPFVETTNFSELAKIIVLLNICLGPLLILLVYKKHKPNLKSDLTILAVIQISAFIFGAYSLYQKHPAYIVFAVDRFTLISPQNISKEKLRYPELKTSFYSSPKLVFAKRPTERNERNELLFSVLFKGAPDLDERAEYYEPFDNHTEKVLSSDINAIALFSSLASKKELTNFLIKYGGKTEDYAFFPLQGKTGDVIWALNRKSGIPIGIINIDPWKLSLYPS